MTLERAIELLKIEMECIKRGDGCDRQCAKCDLVQDQNELLVAYRFLIAALEQLQKRKEQPQVNK